MKPVTRYLRLGLPVLSLTLCLVLSTASQAVAQQDSPSFAFRPNTSREAIIERTLKPYTGDHTPGVDATTLAGKVMCGYQGWFCCPGDGAASEWQHWEKNQRFEPGSCTIDLWPEVSEFDEDERYATSFQHADGSVAEVFSSQNAKTVDRHFLWMKQYGIDGVFLQRFAVDLSKPIGLYRRNRVLTNVRAAANQHGRTWAAMYDLSGLGAGKTRMVINDWKLLVDKAEIGRDSKDKSYLHHQGRPVVAVWGIGFRDRAYTLQECAKLVDFLVNDPDYGGNTVMLGVPTYWRTLEKDATHDKALLAIAESAHIISPWTVGRFSDDEGVERIAKDVWKPDAKWCATRGKDYLPVVFPGFSWHNMNPATPLGAIPRRGGRFLWKQFVELHGIESNMVYQAMFDEVDEATAIFKCSDNPPVGKSRFLDHEGLPSDHYLWLVGQGVRLIRKEIPPTPDLPAREE